MEFHVSPDIRGWPGTPLGCLKLPRWKIASVAMTGRLRTSAMRPGHHWDIMRFPEIAGIVPRFLQSQSSSSRMTILCTTLLAKATGETSKTHIQIMMIIRLRSISCINTYLIWRMGACMCHPQQIGGHLKARLQCVQQGASTCALIRFMVLYTEVASDGGGAVSVGDSGMQLNALERLIILGLHWDLDL